MESTQQAIIPGLPDDLALRCLAKVSHGHHGLLETVSKGWKDLIRSSDYYCYKAREGWCGDWLFVLTEGPNQWIAYDPDADRWHPLPKMPGAYSGWQHYGFSCVCVGNKFIVIGGSYGQSDPVFPHQRPLITNDVLQFDPFKKQWSKVASMRTPRSHFACTVVAGKVYVAGGRTSSSVIGLALAEVYDPAIDNASEPSYNPAVAEAWMTKLPIFNCNTSFHVIPLGCGLPMLRWEDLPTIPTPQMDCVGLTYKGNFYVLSDQVGLPDHQTSEVFDPSDKTWCTVDDIWPFSRAMHFAVQVMGDDQVYTVVDWGESSIKTRDGKGEWHNVGSIPSVVLPDHSRPLEAFGYGFATLRRELYILGGRVLKWEESGVGSVGRFEIVRLGLVTVCDPQVTPLKWRKTKPMCSSAQGSILGCASMEE